MLTKNFTFKDLEQQVLNNFKSLGILFYVDVNRDEIVDKYLSGFSDKNFRQEHNCNCCKSFLRQFGGIVGIKDNKKVSLWDNVVVPEEFEQSVKNLREYIQSRPVTDIFLTKESRCGTKSNLDMKRNVTWNHFYLDIPQSNVVSDKGPLLSVARDSKAVLKRSLDELTLEATETVLDLIAQNSLYRGKEFEPMLVKFQTLQKEYDKLLDEEEKNNFCWVKSKDPQTGTSVSRIRNTAIGTLLIGLSAGFDLEDSVREFERIVAPTNYKRPTSLITPKMVEQAKDKLRELGLLESLERRYANDTDLRVSNVIFKDTPTVVTDVFDEMAKETIVNPRKFSKVEEIGIEDFINNVVPGAKTIEVLFENSHLNNLVTLIAPKDPETLSLFKWNNGFSWSYTGGITDSIKERVKEAGGSIEGELRTSLSWYNYDDLDIHVIEPNNNKIYYGNKGSSTSGRLDVDMNAGGSRSRSAVENIIWKDKSKMLEGTYKVLVNNYQQREKKDAGYIIQIECRGEVFDFESKISPQSGATHTVVEFTYSKKDGITFKGEAKSNVVSKEKWGIKTNQFHKVSKLMFSPNYWNEKVGNKHYMFILEGCLCDENPRPFFNEFLKQDLDENRKVFEILASKVKIEDSANQLSGLGFSETIRSDLIVKVTSTFTRALKVKI